MGTIRRGGGGINARAREECVVETEQFHHYHWTNDSEFMVYCSHCFFSAMKEVCQEEGGDIEVSNTTEKPSKLRVKKFPLGLVT